MLWIVLFCAAGLCVCVRSQTDIVFPHNSHDAEGNKRREPLYAPSRCPVNHLLYPGSQESDWICDCAPGYVYYPEKDGCFATYRQGPCKVGEYLMLDLKIGEYLPRCEENPCGVDGVVQYKGVCHELNKPGGPCQPEKANDTIKILYVVKSTLELRCVAGPEPLVLIKVPRNPCPPGSRRSNSNDCRFGISEEDDD